MKKKPGNYSMIVSCTIAGLVLAGCAQQQQQQQGRYKPSPAPVTTQAPKPAPEPTAAPKIPCSDPTWGLVKMNKTMPPEASLGAEFMAELHLTAQACAANVVVRDTVPANASYVRSEPAATVDGKQLTWQIGDLEAGGARDIKLWLKAEQEGTIVNCASVSADPRTCATTHVVRPAIQLTKTAPAEVIICDPIPMTLTVRNTGSSALTAVKVSDTLPNGLTSDGKTALTFDAGNLAPGESKEFKFNAGAAKTGEFVNKATVASAQGVNAEASSKTIVREPVLTVACEAPDQRFMGRPFDVTFTVVSKGDTAAAGTVLEVPVPTGLTARSASDGGQVSGGKITWDLGSLAVNASKKVTASFVSGSGGNFEFKPTAKGSCAKLVASSCRTVVVGMSALLLEKSDDPDPIAVGETTTYTVKVTNQGTADDTNIKMVVEFPAEISPVSASNGGTIDGKRVTFPAYPRLAPKQAFTYTIQAKGEKVGDARVRFVRTSDGIPAPTSAEESTRVY